MRADLAVDRGRTAAHIRQPGQEALDFGAAQRRRMPHAVELNVGANPMDISLLGSYAVVQAADRTVCKGRCTPVAAVRLGSTLCALSARVAWRDN
jgi:hypothetical protein